MSVGDGKAEEAAHKVQPVVGSAAQFGEMMTFSYLQGFLIFAVVLIIVILIYRRSKSGALKEKSVV